MHMTLQSMQPSTSGRCIVSNVPSPQLTSRASPRASFTKHPRSTPQRLVTVAALGDEKPDWLKLLEEDAQVDADLAALLQGANGNPEEVQRRMRQEMDSLHEHIMTTGGSGSAAPMKVFMRPHDPFSLWIWIQLFAPPSPSEEEMIQEVLGSWFLLGRLGGFDSSNLQTMYSDLIDGAEVEYEVQEGLAATMHDLGEIETNGNWVRVNVDMGTADELALDILINALTTLSKEHVGIRKVMLGGELDDWPTPEREIPTVTMQPMSVPNIGDAIDDGDEFSF